MQHCHLASTKHDEPFLSLKHLTLAQAQVSFTWALGTTGCHWESAVAWLSESLLLPRKTPGEIHPETGGVKSVRSVVLMAVVLTPKGSWSRGAMSESSWPTAKCRQDKPPNTPNSHPEQHFSREDEDTLPVADSLQDLYPSLPSRQDCQGQARARTAIARSPSGFWKCWSAGSSSAF